MFDPTGLVSLVENHVHSICGPTVLAGEIDDGHVESALDMRLTESAFPGSTCVWKKPGTGHAVLTLRNQDDREVEVLVYSGGYKLNALKVAKGATVRLPGLPLSQLQGKTRCIARNRPCLMVFKARGDDSLMLCVPVGTTGGLSVDVVIKKPSKSDDCPAPTPSIAPSPVAPGAGTNPTAAGGRATSPRAGSTLQARTPGSIIPPRTVANTTTITGAATSSRGVSMTSSGATKMPVPGVKRTLRA